jgi:hypothetical protein
LKKSLCTIVVSFFLSFELKNRKYCCRQMLKTKDREEVKEEEIEKIIKEEEKPLRCLKRNDEIMKI